MPTRGQCSGCPTTAPRCTTRARLTFDETSWSQRPSVAPPQTPSRSDSPTSTRPCSHTPSARPPTSCRCAQHPPQRGSCLCSSGVPAAGARQVSLFIHDTHWSSTTAATPHGPGRALPIVYARFQRDALVSCWNIQGASGHCLMPNCSTICADQSAHACGAFRCLYISFAKCQATFSLQTSRSHSPIHCFAGSTAHQSW